MGAVTVIMQLIFVIGLFLIMVAIIQAANPPPDQKVIYRYVPRSFIEEQENPVPLDDIFYHMFNSETPWVGSVDTERRRNDIGENLNKYYVTQI